MRNKLSILARYISILFVLTFGLVSIIGSGGGSSSSSSPDISTPAANISGAVMKGIIINGLVKAYPIEDGMINEADPFATGEIYTDSAGKYSLTLESGYSGPVALTIEAVEGTIMKCDVPAGCGDGSAFGDEVPLVEGFKLYALVAATKDGDNITMQITPMTAMAAFLAMHNAEGTALGLTADQINLATSQVANLFGLTLTSINTHEVIDITDPAAFAAAGADGQNAALLAAGIMNAALEAKTSAADLHAAFDEFVNEFLAVGGQLYHDDDDSGGIVSLQDIYAQELLVLTEVGVQAAGQEVPVEIPNYEILVSDITTKEAGENIFELTDVQPSEDALSPGLVKTKAFVSDIRNLYYSMQTINDPYYIPPAEYDPDSGEAKFAANVNDFQAQMDLAAQSLSGDTDVVLTATGIAVEAIGIALGDYILNDNIPSGQIFINIEIPDCYGDCLLPVPVTIIQSGNKYTIGIDMPSEYTGGGPAVYLTTVFDIAAFNESETSNQYALSVNASIGLAGSVNYGMMKLTVNEGSIATLNMSVNEQWSQTGDYYTGTYNGTTNITVTSATLDLDAKLEQLDGINPVRFEGNLKCNLGNLVAKNTQSETWNNSNYTYTWEDVEQIGFSTATLSLNGTLGNSVSSLDVILSVSADGNGFTLSNTDGYNGSHYYHNTNEETNSNFIKLGFNLQFIMTMPGLSEEAKVTIAGDRNTFDDGTGTVTIAYEGKTITIGVAANLYPALEVLPVTVSNQDGVQALLELDNVGLLSGSIRVDGVEYASIEEVDLGLKISYTDGAFEIY